MKKTHIIAIVIIAIAIGAILSTLADSSTYASFRVAEEEPSKTFHVVGKLNKEKQVQLHKAKPQDFEKSEQIVVIGKMEAGNFVASDILMKCPSKYNTSSEDMKAVTSQR